AMGSARSWLLKSFLILHGDKARTELPPSQPWWRGNPSLEAQVALLEWSRTHLKQPTKEFFGVHRVHFFGKWPPLLPGRDDLKQREPESESERLEWLNRAPSFLMVRLTGWTPRRFLTRQREGRWLLLTLLRRDAPLKSWRESCQRLWSQLKLNNLVFLWLVELGSGEVGGPLRRAIGSPTMPLFVAATRYGDNFLVPGFERGGVTMLIDPRLRVRMVVLPGIPLPVLKNKITGLIQGHN
ncbi:MAG: hypothetical protein V3T77_10630, partial [Planctomycetota bacterium]